MANVVRVGEHLYRCSSDTRDQVDTWLRANRIAVFHIYMDSEDVIDAMSTYAINTMTRTSETKPRNPVTHHNKGRATANREQIEQVLLSSTARPFFIKFDHYNPSRAFAAAFTDVRFMRPSVSAAPEPYEEPEES